MQDPLMDVRTALAIDSNADGSLVSGQTVEIQHKVDQVIADIINRGRDLGPLVARKPLDQLSYHWNLRTYLSDGTNNKFQVYSDGAHGTPYPSKKIQLIATAISYRSDYEVTGLLVAGSSSYYDALGDEASTALDELKLGEEKMMICGADTGAYGVTSGFDGLLQCMRWHSSNGGDTEGTSANKMADTDVMFGQTRADSTLGKGLDVSYVIAGTAGTSTGVLELKHLDKALTQSNKKGGKGHERIFFCSEERTDEINQLLQPQQRFAGTLNLEGGFTLSTYKGTPIIGSRFMDQNGATNESAWDSTTDADNSMYLLDLNEIQMRILAGVDAQHVMVEGAAGTGYNRADVRGGYFKTYGIFVFRSFNSQVHIANLTAPA